MPLVSQCTPAVGAFAWLAATALLPIGSPADAPRDAEPAKGLRTDVRSQTGGQTIGGVPTNMVLVPGGSFTMGIDEKTLQKLLDNPDNRKDAGEHLVALYPEHLEQAGDLLVDKYEVSNVQYKRWLESQLRDPSPDLIKWNWISFKNGKPIEGLPEDQQDNPIRAISGDDAIACSRWMGKRLPTEIEWEYVARRGLKNQVFPWGATFADWDPAKCANSNMAGRGVQGFQTFKPGSFKDDVTVDGIFDMCGNVAEWTSSPFVAYPGFQAVEHKDSKGKKQTFRGTFASDVNVVRGGSFFGNHLTCNFVWRKGENPRGILEAVGFRCVMSALPGLDQMRDAEKGLALLSSDITGKLEYTPEGLAAQLVQYVEADTGLARGCKYFALSRIRAIPTGMLKLENDSVEKPVFLFAMTTSEPIANPKLPKGSYALYFRGKGQTAAQRAEAEAARKAKAKEEADAKKAKKSDKKDADKKKADDKKPDEKKPDDKKDGDAKKGEGDKPAADPAADAAAADAKQDEKKDEPAAEEAPKAISFVDVPHDRDVFIIKNEAGAIVAFIEAKNLGEAALGPVQFTYATGAASGKPTAVSSGSGSPMIVGPPHDVATIVAPVKIGTSNKYPRFQLTLEFEAGTFEPVTPR